MMKEIKDPFRLTVGDLIVVPTEAGKAHPRLHLPVPSSYRAHGVSMGFTSRSRNSVDAVRELLCKDTGKTRTFYVHDVSLRRSVSSAADKYARLLGGQRTVSDAPEGRPIFAARFAELPQPGFEERYGYDLVRLWAENNEDAVAGVLEGLLLRKHLTVRFGSCCGPEARDRALQDAFGSDASVEGSLARVEGGRSLWSYLPYTDRTGAGEDKLAKEGIINRFLSADMFEPDNDAGRTRYFRGSSSLFVEPKLFLHMQRYGARFLRPDAEFTALMARHCAAEMLARYAQRQTVVLKRTATFIKALAADVNTVKWRGKSACDAVRKLSLRKPEAAKMLKELK